MTSEARERFAALATQPLAPAATAQRGVVSTVRELYRHRGLLHLLVRRDVKARYKDSALGMLWVLINPLFQLLIYWLVVGQILGAARGLDDFAVYVFSGLTIYALYSEAVSSSTGSIVANAGLVKKVYVPREMFPLAATGSSLVTFAVQLAVLALAALTLGSAPLDLDILFAVPAVLIILTYATALGMLLSAVNVYLRDVQYLTSLLLTITLWGSPIVYGWSMVRDLVAQFGLPSWAMEVYGANPVTLAVLGFHRAFWPVGTAAEYPPDLLLRMGIAVAIGLVLVWLAQRVFARIQGNFAQEL